MIKNNNMFKKYKCTSKEVMKSSEKILDKPPKKDVQRSSAVKPTPVSKPTSTKVGSVTAARKDTSIKSEKTDKKPIRSVQPKAIKDEKNKDKKNDVKADSSVKNLFYLKRTKVLQ